MTNTETLLTEIQKALLATGLTTAQLKDLLK